MTYDLNRAADFMAGHSRTLDRRRFDLLFGTGGPEPVLAALDGYRNPDGGYGAGLEPDIRDLGSQPGAGLHAFEVLSEPAGLDTADRAARSLADWYGAVSDPDGMVPFAFPVTHPVACAPYWANPPAGPSLQITSISLVHALGIPALREHSWVRTALQSCLSWIDSPPQPLNAFEVAFSAQLLNTAFDTEPEAERLLTKLAADVPSDGVLVVEGAYAMRPLDFAPAPGPARELLDRGLVERELDRLADSQEEDGGWTVDFPSFSDAARLEWRGYTTVANLKTLRENGR